jgi:hypothetical protein
MSASERRLSTRDLAGETAPLGTRDDDSDAVAGSRAPLFEPADTDSFRTRWQEIQVRFVDEPGESVERADALVAELMQRLAQVFAREREGLEQQWNAGDNVGTEELRVALRRYRSFFERLLST